MSEIITITKLEYDRLITSELWLQALEAAGINSWEGFEVAQEIYEGYLNEL